MALADLSGLHDRPEYSAARIVAYVDAFWVVAVIVKVPFAVNTGAHQIDAVSSPLKPFTEKETWEYEFPWLSVTAIRGLLRLLVIPTTIACPTVGVLVRVAVTVKASPNATLVWSGPEIVPPPPPPPPEPPTPE
jgi:hypothetical protein